MSEGNTSGNDVVIVGGGVAGCATAYFLSLAGVKATVIEREGIGSQASGYSSGGLNPLEGAQIPGPLAPLAMASYDLHREMCGAVVEASGIDYEYRVVSLIHAAMDDGEMEALGPPMSCLRQGRGSSRGSG